MDDYDAFVDALRSDRGNDALFLVFADWLEEHSDPRADLVRWQVARARLAVDDPVALDLDRCEQDWLREHGALLLGELEPHALDWRLERGFVAEATVEVSVYLERAEALCQAAPLARFRVVTDRQCDADGNELLRCLAELPQLGRVHALEVQRCAVDAEGVAALVAAGGLDGLVFLDLSHNLLGDVGPQALAWSPRLARLETLVLRHSLIGDRGLEALARAPYLGRLEVLDLEGNSVSDLGLAALADAPLLPRLTTLDLRNNMVSDLGVQALVAAEQLEGLTGLDLGGNHITNAGAALLAGCVGLRHLRGLDLGGNHLTGAGWGELRQSPYLGHLFHDRHTRDA